MNEDTHGKHANMQPECSPTPEANELYSTFKFKESESIDEIGTAEGEGGGKKKDKSARGNGAAVRGRDAHIYDAAIHFIEKHKDGPFYINIWDHIPHHPVNPSRAVIAAFGPLQVDESKFPPEMQAKFAICRKLGGDVSEHMRAWLWEVKAVDDEAACS